MFDLDADPLLIGRSFASNAVLGPLWAQFPGLRLACGWDSFEMSVTTILGQLVSTGQGRALVKQLVESCGQRIAHPVTDEPAYLFPTAEVLATADLAAVRTSPARKNAIKELSGLVAAGGINLDGTQEVGEVKERLLALPGIGSWTSEYIGLRALGDSDSFPKTDLVLKRAVGRHPGLDLESVRPWRGYAAACLWAHWSESTSKKGS